MDTSWFFNEYNLHDQEATSYSNCQKFVPIDLYGYEHRIPPRRETSNIEFWIWLSLRSSILYDKKYKLFMNWSAAGVPYSTLDVGRSMLDVQGRRVFESERNYENRSKQLKL